MEDQEKKYKELPTNQLKRLFGTTQGEDHKIITEILFSRGFDMITLLLEDYDIQESIVPDNKAVNSFKKVIPENNRTKNEIVVSDEKQTKEKINREPKNLQFYKVHNLFLQKFGVDVAVIISIFVFIQQYRDKYERTDIDGYFYLEHPKIEKMTHITIYRQRKAMELLVESKILKISEKKKGTPPKKFYRVDIDRHDEILQQLSDENQN